MYEDTRGCPENHKTNPTLNNIFVVKFATPRNRCNVIFKQYSLLMKCYHSRPTESNQSMIKHMLVFAHFYGFFMLITNTDMECNKFEILWKMKFSKNYVSSLYIHVDIV